MSPKTITEEFDVTLHEIEDVLYKILFDNGTPRSVYRCLLGREVTRARQIGWHEREDGELMQRAGTGWVRPTLKYRLVVCFTQTDGYEASTVLA